MRTRMTSGGGFTCPSCQTAPTTHAAARTDPRAERRRTAGRSRRRARDGPRDRPGRRPLVRTAPRRAKDAARASAGSRDLLVGLEVQDAVAPATTPVDDARAVRVGVVEEEEVVADELHLVDGVLEGHRGGRVDLLAHLDRRVAERAEAVEVVDASVVGGRVE